MDYGKMSDFEIDAAVSKILYPGRKVTNFAGEAVMWDDKNNTQIVRYCHSWSDAGPVIFKNRISLEAQITHDDCLEMWHAYPTQHNEFCCIGENPLRAAMIVFLMMNEDRYER